MSEPHTQLRETLLDFLWNQWDSLGASARGTGGAVPFIIDPEALLLASMRFGATDARMPDVIADWIEKNGSFLNLQRLKNLQSNTKLGTHEDLATLAGMMLSAGFKNWKSLGESLPKPSAGKTHPRRMSQSPDPARPENFLLRMRMLFGLSARPEIITWLLTHPSGHAAEIARETGWLSKSVQAILNDLQASGMLLTHIDGRKKVVSVNPRTSIAGIGVSDKIHWFTQAPFYLGILHVIRTHERLEQNPDASDSVKSILIHQDLSAINAAFRLSGTVSPFMAMAPLRGQEAVDAFETGCWSLVGIISAMNLP